MNDKEVCREVQHSNDHMAKKHWKLIIPKISVEIPRNVAGTKDGILEARHCLIHSFTNNS